MDKIENVEQARAAIKQELANGNCNLTEAITATAVLDMLAALQKIAQQFGMAV